MDLLPDIGFAAGEIYFCGIEKPVELQIVKKRVSRREDIFNMALGWLSREGKIEIYTEKTKTYIRKIG
ncbi:MAG: winged helix-turn-helix domain-containing protein [Candidatus Altiarchaeota archaeon]|nr:winged helix-turn-helix domain-containing protein [Candidatus Altiarchaeota archaeon]